MQPTLSPKPTDDPCDDVVTVPDAAQIAPSDEELSNLLQQAARHRSATQLAAAPDLRANAPTPAIDTTHRSAAANDERSSQQDHSARASAPIIDVMDRPAHAADVLGSEHQRSWLKGAGRAFIVLLLASCIGIGAAAWKSYGAVATKTVTRLAAQIVNGSALPHQSVVAAQPAPAVIRAEAPDATSGQPTVAQTTPAPDVTAPAPPATPDQTQVLQSMTRDLATLQQQVEELKADIEQLKTSQQQMSRDLAKVSEQKKPVEANLRPKASTGSASPPTSAARSAAVQTKKPIRSTPQGYAAAAPAARQAPAPYQAPPSYHAPSPYYAPVEHYVPPQPQPPPEVAAEPSVEYDSSVLRPPMPVR